MYERCSICSSRASHKGCSGPSITFLLSVSGEPRNRKKLLNNMSHTDLHEHGICVVFCRFLCTFFLPTKVPTVSLKYPQRLCLSKIKHIYQKKIFINLYKVKHRFVWRVFKKQTAHRQNNIKYYIKTMLLKLSTNWFSVVILFELLFLIVAL